VATISHIPAGRALRVIASLFESISPGGENLFWSLAAALTPEEAERALLDVDLNCFGGAWRFDAGGSITRVREGSFDAANIVAGAVKALAVQYTEAIDLIDPLGTCDEIILAGGLPRRIPAFAILLGRACKRRLRTTAGTEETLAGLARLADGLTQMESS
jgi:hypothetical protein